MSSHVNAVLFVAVLLTWTHHTLIFVHVCVLSVCRTSFHVNALLSDAAPLLSQHRKVKHLHGNSYDIHLPHRHVQISGCGGSREAGKLRRVKHLHGTHATYTHVCVVNVCRMSSHVKALLSDPVLLTWTHHTLISVHVCVLSVCRMSSHVRYQDVVGREKRDSIGK
jgi:hypothetical protein